MHAFDWSGKVSSRLPLFNATGDQMLERIQGSSRYSYPSTATHNVDPCIYVIPLRKYSSDRSQNQFYWNHVLCAHTTIRRGSAATSQISHVSRRVGIWWLGGPFLTKAFWVPEPIQRWISEEQVKHELLPVTVHKDSRQHCWVLCTRSHGNLPQLRSEAYQD